VAASSFLALSCVGFIVSAPARADPVKDPVPSDVEQRPDVVVTGERERRAADPKAVAPLVDTPRSIVVLPREVIEQSGSNSLADALRTVPGITFGAAEGGNPVGDRPFIRGFDSQGSTYLDGVRDIGSQSREIFAVEQVQIVRGSDSTLGGRGAAGGTLNIQSKLPREGNFAHAAISYGTADYKRATADLNLQIADQVAVRLNSVWHDQDVAGRDALFQKRWGVAPSLTVGIDGPTRLTATYYHLETDELPDSGFPYAYVASASVNATPAGSSSLIYSEPAVGRFTTAAGVTGTISPDNFYGLASRDFRDTSTDQAMVRVEHDFGGIRLRNTARYSRTSQAYIFTQPDDSQGNVFGVPAGNRNAGTLPGTGRFNDYTAGGRVWRRANTRFSSTESLIDQLDLSGTVRTGGIEHSFAVGGEIAWEDAERGAYVVNTGVNNGTAGLRCGTAPGVSPFNCADLFNPDPNDPWVNIVGGVAAPMARGGPDTTTLNSGKTKAVYAFDSITLASALILNLGIRYEDFESRVRLPMAGGVRPEVRRRDDFVTYQAGLVLKPTRNTSVYASYATSATPPNSLIGEGQETNSLGTVGGAAGQAAIDALRVERSRSFEVGAKADLFGEQLSLTAALFRTETRNARVLSDVNTVAFIGERRVDGVELGFNGRITPAWHVFGGYTYLDAEIVDGGSTAFVLPAGGGVPARTVLLPSVNTGRQFPQTARHSVTLWTNYDVGGFDVGGGAFYTSRVFGGYADDRFVSGTGAAATVVPATVVIARSVPAYWRFDARAGIDVTQKVQLAVNIQNVTNKRYFAQAFSSHYGIMAAGRTAFATLSLRY
jgi:catecholate siderophore receptor